MRAAADRASAPPYPLGAPAARHKRRTLSHLNPPSLVHRLVEEGILERVRYSERPERYEYRLTQKGRDLNVALAGLRQWGDKYRSEKPPVLLRRKTDKKQVVAALVPKGSDMLRAEELELVPGRGQTTR